MKWIKLLVTVIIIGAVFSGCSFRLASSVDELISPVAPEGDNADVQIALEGFSKGGFSLKTPVSGEYTTSYIFYDVDTDGENEAIVFYEPASELGTINMALIDKTNGTWSVAGNTVIGGTSIYSVNFSDVNGDEKPEIIVLWDVIKHSSSHSLSVFSQMVNDKDKTLIRIGDEIAANAYTIVDMDSDGVSEIMIFTAQTGDSNTAYAMLYSYKDGSVNKISKTKLDGHITSYERITCEKTDNKVYIYADAVNSNGVQMHTEVIYWSDYYDSIISPFYNYSTGVTKGTSRKAMMTSRDINNDGVIEIPLDASKKKLPANVEAINWKQYNNSVLKHKAYSIAIQKDNYQLVIPDEEFEKISVEYDSGNSVLTVTDNEKNTVFTVAAVLKSQYDEKSADYSQYTQIMDGEGYVYLAKAENDAKVKITAEDLKSMIKSYKLG